MSVQTEAKRELNSEGLILPTQACKTAHLDICISGCLGCRFHVDIA